MSKISRILIPALILQGVVIGGGYATGRELVEYFLRFGIGGAFAGLLVVCIIWSVVFSLIFLFARTIESYDYGAFTRALLGRFQYAFDLVILTFLLLVVAVICAATGEIVSDLTGVDEVWGAIALSLTVAAGLMLKSDLLARIIAAWSILLYVAYGALAVMTLSNFSPEIAQAFSEAEFKDGWFRSALTYSAYNLVAAPAVLFVLSRLRTPTETVVSAVASSCLVLAPGALIAIIFTAHLPDILDAPVPVAIALGALSNGAIALFVQLAILGTFWQTAVGSLHAVNERMSAVIAPRIMPRWARGAFALVFITSALVLGTQFGVIAIIANGYSALTLGFVALFVVPLFTIGLFKLWKAAPKSAFWQALEHRQP